MIDRFRLCARRGVGFADVAAPGHPGAERAVNPDNLMTSVLPLKADSGRTSGHVRKVPNPEVAASFDHPVGAGHQSERNVANRNPGTGSDQNVPTPPTISARLSRTAGHISGIAAAS
jgi:hypothetical protein